MNTNNDKWNKPLGIILCMGVFAGLIYFSSLNRTKAEEFSKAVGQDSASIESKSSEEAKVATLNNFRNHVAPVFKWNLDKEWEWKPFDAGDEVELKEIKNIEKYEMENIRFYYSSLRKVIAKEIVVTVEAHLLPDPRLSDEALDDFIKFWGHSALFSGALKKDIKYFAAISPQFNEQEIQTIAEARQFFSDKGKMEKIRQKIIEAKSIDNFFEDSHISTLRRELLINLTNIKNIVYQN